MSLTVKRVARLREPGRYGDGPRPRGLYLQVSASGAKFWVFRYERGGVERMMGLGPWPDVSLEEARTEAHAARGLLRKGVDPIEQKRALKAATLLEASKQITFKEAAERFYQKKKEAKWTNARHRKQFISSLEMHVHPKIGALNVTAIDTGAVLSCIKPIWVTIPETASRLLQRIAAVLDWAKANDYPMGDNPASWDNIKDRLPDQPARDNHFAALPFAEVPSFMAALREQDGVGPRTLEFIILTACRTGEALRAEWTEINGSTWTIPAARMKNRKEHRVPLARSVVELLSRLPQDDGPFVFTTGGGRPLSSVMYTLRTMDRAEITVHGFRSSFRDWAAEKTTFDNIVVEKALAHTISSAVEKSYRRGDLFEKRRGLMEAWSSYCSGEICEVIPLPAVRAS